MSNVNVDYSDFSKDNPVVDKIVFHLLPNTILVLQQETEEQGTENEATSLSISMINTESDEVEISGTLDTNTINSLIRSLSIFKKQLVE